MFLGKWKSKCTELDLMSNKTVRNHLKQVIFYYLFHYWYGRGETDIPLLSYSGWMGDISWSIGTVVLQTTVKLVIALKSYATWALGFLLWKQKVLSRIDSKVILTFYAQIPQACKSILFPFVHHIFHWYIKCEFPKANMEKYKESTH